MLGINRLVEFSYANARAKAMKSLLLSQAKMRELASVPNATDIAALLEETPYKNELVELASKYQGTELVERAISKNMERTLAKLFRISPPSGHRVLLSLMRSWEIHNLKVLLAGKSQGRGPEELSQYLVSVGCFTQSILDHLLKANSVEEIVHGIVGTEYCAVLSPLLKKYSVSKDVLPLLNALDQYSYESLATVARETTEPAVAALIKSYIDSKNISTKVRCLANGFSPAKTRELLVDGGNLRKETLDSLAKAPDLKLVNTMSSSFDLTQAIDEAEKQKSMIPIETSLEKQTARKGSKSIRLAPPSVSSLVSYLLLKETEVSNIRKIVRGKEYGLPREKIMGMTFGIE